jgi:hypothetical protein
MMVVARHNEEAGNLLPATLKKIYVCRVTTYEWDIRNSREQYNT